MSLDIDPCQEASEILENCSSEYSSEHTKAVYLSDSLVLKIGRKRFGEEVLEHCANYLEDAGIEFPETEYHQIELNHEDYGVEDVVFQERVFPDHREALKTYGDSFIQEVDDILRKAADHRLKLNCKLENFAGGPGNIKYIDNHDRLSVTRDRWRDNLYERMVRSLNRRSSTL